MSTSISIDTINTLTKEKLKQELTQRGIPFKPKDNKPQLIEKLKNYLESTQTSTSTSTPNRGNTAASSSTPNKKIQPSSSATSQNKNIIPTFFKYVKTSKLGAVKKLLENQVHFNINVKDEYGATALHWALRNNNKDMTNFLLSIDGIDVNATAKDGGTPLHWGAYDAHDGSAIKDFLEKKKQNVNIEAKNKDGNTALVVALNPQSDMNYMKYVKLFTEDYPIMRGREEVQWDVAEILLEHKAKMAPFRVSFKNSKKDEGYTTTLLTHFVSKARFNTKLYTEIIKFLLQYKPNLEEKTYSETTLITAVDDELVSIILLLLDAGVNINNSNYDGVTPLMKAAMTNKMNIVKLLLEKGADVNAETKKGETAFYFALHRGHIDVSKLLLEHKAIHYPYYYDDVDDIYIRNYIETLNDYYRRYGGKRNEPQSIKELKQQLLDNGLIFQRPSRFKVLETEEEIETYCKSNCQDNKTHTCTIGMDKLEPKLTIAIRTPNENSRVPPSIFCYGLETIIEWFKAGNSTDPITRKRYTPEEIVELRQIIENYNAYVQSHPPPTTGGKNKKKNTIPIKLTSRQIKLLQFLQKTKEK